MNEKDHYFLLYLARNIGFHGTMETSTGKIAKGLDISQQTVSRKLLEFAEEGLIIRSVTSTGMKLALAEKSREKLRTLYGELQTLFGKQLTLSGILKDGLGEGRFYMSQEQYKKQFQSFLGFVPYQGTLNISVDKDAAVAFVATKKQLYITGFSTKERTFGGLKCYSVLIAKKIPGAVIVPDRTAHTLETIELIAAVNLREMLELENGKKITVQ